MFQPRHHARPSVCLGRATTNSHFIHEGYGLGTFHMTLNRPYAFYCVPKMTSALRSLASLGTNLRRRSDFDAWSTLRLTKYTRHLHSPLGERGQSGLYGLSPTKLHPLFADEPFRIETSNPSDCWLLSAVTPRTLTSLSLPSFIGRDHCQAHGS